MWEDPICKLPKSVTTAGWSLILTFLRYIALDSRPLEITVISPLFSISCSLYSLPPPPRLLRQMISGCSPFHVFKVVSFHHILGRCDSARTGSKTVPSATRRAQGTYSRCNKIRYADLAPGDWRGPARSHGRVTYLGRGAARPHGRSGGERLSGAPRMRWEGWLRTTQNIPSTRIGHIWSLRGQKSPSMLVGTFCKSALQMSWSWSWARPYDIKLSSACVSALASMHLLSRSDYALKQHRFDMNVELHVTHYHMEDKLLTGTVKAAHVRHVLPCVGFEGRQVIWRY